MLVIDEIHSILAGTFHEQRIVLNAIRFLANDLRIPLVCVGTHEAKQARMTATASLGITRSQDPKEGSGAHRGCDGPNLPFA